MPDEDKNFGGSLVLDFRKWWRHVKTIYRWLSLGSLKIKMTKIKLLRRAVALILVNLKRQDEQPDFISFTKTKNKTVIKMS